MMERVIAVIFMIGVSLCVKAEDDWTLLQSNVCFGAKDDAYGSFKTTKSGYLRGLKFVHESGYISCVKDDSRNANWGCVGYGVNIVVTDDQNQHILTLLERRSLIWKSAEAQSITLNVFLKVKKDQEFRIWQKEDLRNSGEWNNHGTSCATVYGELTACEEKSPHCPQMTMLCKNPEWKYRMKEACPIRCGHCDFLDSTTKKDILAKSFPPVPNPTKDLADTCSATPYECELNKYQVGYQIEKLGGLSIEECGKKCCANQLCVGFDYNATLMGCKLSSRSPKKSPLGTSRIGTTRCTKKVS